MHRFSFSCLDLKHETVLITGVSGLIGRLLFHHLSKKLSHKYYVIGLDQHLNHSIRYQWTNSSEVLQKRRAEINLDPFYQCDITDRDRLYQIIAKENVQTIIHLAAALETEHDLDKIRYVNIIGTRHIFEAREFFS